MERSWCIYWLAFPMMCRGDGKQIWRLWRS
jgi:hypothetical protein